MAGSRVVISGVCALILIGSVAAGRLRASASTLATSSADFTASSSALSKGGMPGDAIQRVVQMLDNLIAQMDAEQASDEKQLAEFTEWCGKQQAASESHIGSLDTEIEELTASLAQLYSRKVQLEDAIAKLDVEIQNTKTQIATATQKREEEHASFVTEQTDFDNSIAACNKAISILSKHYGDGTVKEAEKPAWMTASFAQVATVLGKVVGSAKRSGKRVPPAVLSLVQQPTEFGRYQAKTGEGLSIVDQMAELRDTFEEDKESAIEEEKRLNGLYVELMTEKTAILNSLVGERNEQQSILNAVNQDIAEKESAKANAEAERKDEQAYLAQTKKSCADTQALFEARQKDRAAEKLATQEAIKVLGGSAGAALTQLQQDAMRSAHFSWIQQHASHKDKLCPKCSKAAALLSKAASSLRSTTLATAAAATMGTDAVQDVIAALNEMLGNLAKDAQMEKEHKEWCEHELAATTAKKATHEGIVAELAQKIADTTEDIAEKKQAIQDTTNGIARLDKNFNEATALRAQEKQKFDSELADYNDAITALNQAIDILSKFYAEKGAFLQAGAAEAAGPREVTPGVFDKAYEQKGGAGIVQMISTVRKEYEQGKADLEAAEAQAIQDYADAKKAYQKMRSDMVSQMDRLEAELQTAEANLDQYQDDKASNEDEIQAATTYLGQLANSCNSLLSNYDARVKHRHEEKAAIQEAIRVLEEEA